jgi:16S rRNA (guanine527-N7)-methyltransferase
MQSMQPSRIAELLEPFLTPCHSEPDRRFSVERAVLSPTQLQHISTYIDILLRWNARINLTAIRDPEEIVTRHFGESLFAARHLFPTTAHVGTAALGCPAERSSALPVADLGSGAGFPGIPVKLWAPNIALTLIESNHKKAAFLSEVTRALTLTDVNIQNTRAETLPPSTFDVITLRAVERFAEILTVAAYLLKPGGRLALLIGPSQQSAACSALPQFAWRRAIPIPESSRRILLIGTQNKNSN